jgi:integrase
MEVSNPDAGQKMRWNKGKLVGQEPPLRLKEIWAIRIRLQLAKRIRELALFNLALDSKLRGCDLVSLRVGDVAQSSRVSARAMVLQRKTQRPVQFELPEQTREAVAAWIAKAQLRSGDYLFPSKPGARLISRLVSTPGSLTSGLPPSAWTAPPTAPIPCTEQKR